MIIIKILMIVSFANLIYDLTKIIEYCFDQSKRKKKDKQYISGYIKYNDGVGIKGTMNNQIVYKVDGDFNGDIKGDNVTVILMGNGNINGNIESKDGNVVLIKGNVNGDIKANKVVCPTKPTIKDKNQHICKSCYHYLQTPTGSYCTESYELGDALPVGCNVCKSYDGTGETTKYKSDCARFSNRSGICHFFHVNTCNLEHNCPYKIKRENTESPKLSVKTLWSCDIPSNNRGCSKCAFAKKMPYLSLSGINTDDEYNCLKFNKIVDGDYYCQDFIDSKTVENLNKRINDIINRK